MKPDPELTPTATYPSTDVTILTTAGDANSTASAIDELNKVRDGLTVCSSQLV
jgi:hypothetical protein